MAETVVEVLPNVFRWEVYSAEHQVELTSHAVLLNGNLYCFDPIRLASKAFEVLTARGTPKAIILTNGNHERDATAWAKEWNVPVCYSIDAELSFKGARYLREGDSPFDDDWVVHPLFGGGPGEIALRSRSFSLVMVGDAIVNLPNRQLEVLPARYCRNKEALHESLRKLAEEPFERMCVAHGQPIASGASEKVLALLH